MHPQKEFQIGDLRIDFDAYRLHQADEPIRLTRTEWALLRELVLHKNQVLSHHTLLQRVWGVGYDDESDYVHTYISRLRRKIEADTSDPQYIITEPGIGYRFQADESRRLIASPAAPTGVQTVNPLPQQIGKRYLGREVEQQTLHDLIKEGTRLISIYGRAGVGKTALVCKVLADLQRPDAAVQVDGMVFLSAPSTGIGMARIFSDFGRLLGLSDSGTTELTQRITNLLERLSRGNYILLLDNLESVQNPATGELIDADLQVFFRLAIEQSDALSIIVTSREPVLLPRSARVLERRLPLDEGLLTVDSIALLRVCDVDGAAGLRDAPDALLEAIAQRTRGYPRALEAVVGLLVEDPFLSPENLLDEALPASDEISAVLVEQAMQRLDDTARRVMQIVAAFRSPVSLKELQQIADAFLPDGTDLRQILQRLVQTYCLNYDATTQRITIHPLDRDYCYAQIPEQDTHNPPFTRHALHKAIATLYKEEQPQRSLEDGVESYLNQFNHLVRAGDYREAADLLLWMDEMYLSRRDFNADLFDMYSRVLPNLADDDLWRACMLRKGEASRRIAQLNYATHCFETVLQKSRSADDPHHVAQALNSMGWAQYDLGHFRLAVDFWEQALTRFDAQKLVEGMADAHGGIGWAQYLLGDYEMALQNFDRAEALSLQAGDDLARALNLGDKGVVYIAQGEFENAIAVLNESLNLADTLSAGREGSYKGGYLAAAYLLSGQLEEADDIARMTLSLGGALTNEPTVQALHGVILARMGQHDAAVAAFERAVILADKVLELTLGLYRVRYARALANAGLTLLDDSLGLDVVLMDYSIGMAICREKGVLHANAQLLDALLVLDGNKLSAVREMLKRE